MKADQEWVASLKKGDEVVITWDQDPDPTLTHVSAVFDGKIRVCGIDFDHETGRPLRSGEAYLRRPTNEEIEAQRRRVLVLSITEAARDSLSTDRLEAALALLTDKGR